MKNTAILLFFALWVPASVAQNPGTGLTPFGSLSSFGFDTINNQNLNAYFAIPLVSSPGRGYSLTVSLINNSLIWQKAGTNWVPVVDQTGTPTWGWLEGMPPGGKVQFKSNTGNLKCVQTGQLVPFTFYSGYTYIDALGTTHVAGQIQFQRSTLCPAQNGGTSAGYVADPTGFFISDPNGGNPTVKSARGNENVSGNSTAIDTNGNFITKTVVSSTEVDYTDSVGNRALKVLSTPNSTNPTQIQYQFLDGTGTGTYKTITLTLGSFNIKTNFLCANVGEYSGTANLPTELDIPTPGGTALKYLFSYEPTPGFPGFYTGRVKKVTLPTDGSYEYDYPGSNDSVNCADGTTTSLNRVVSDGTSSATWNFVRNLSNSTTTVTTPVLADTSNPNDTVYTFNTSGQETSRKLYANSPGTTLLRTINTTWVNGTPSTQVTILEDGSTRSETDTTFDSNGLLQSMSEYDLGSGARGSLLRTTTLTYQTSTNYTSRNIINLVTSRVIKDGSGTIQYRQDTAYDGVSLSSCPTGAPQHDDTTFSCTMNFRGNPTSVTTYLTPGTPANPITKNFTYDWFGNLLTAQPDCCQHETFNYSATTVYSHPDSITRGAGSTLTTNYTYFMDTGQIKTAVNENNQTTSFNYDFLWRPTSVVRPDGSTASYSYGNVNFKATTKSPIDSSRAVQTITSVDTLGRPVTSSLEDASNVLYSQVSTQYDFAGRPYRTSNPYTGSPSFWTTTAFDALGRPTSVTLPDSSTTTYLYANQNTTVTDPAGKQRKTVADGAGRLASVFEPDITNNNSLTLQTAYTYTVLNALATVTQGQQTRTYNYDALGRLSSFKIPETQQTLTTFTYDNFDDVLTRTDPRGVVTTYGYDGLNRLQTVIYTIPQGSGVAATPSLSYTYGANQSLFNNGRLITMTDGAGSESYTYNNLGEMTQLQKVLGSTTYTTAYQYNQAGQITQITYPSGRIVQQNMDALGRLCAVGGSASSCLAGTLYSSGFGYNTAQQLTGFNYGNGVVATLGYSADRLQLTSLNYKKGTATLFGLNYTYGTAGTNNGQITGITDTVDNGRSVTFMYDPLARLASAVTTGSTNYPKWGLEWTYDRYANRTLQTLTAGTAPAPSTPTDATSNRMTGYTYDAAGNLTNDSVNTMTYDGESRVVTGTGSLGSGTYSYDGNGLRVKKVSGGTTIAYVFAGEQVIAEYQNGAAPSSPTREYIYSSGTLLAKIEAGSTIYYHPESLSNRLITDSTGTVIGEQGHFPFGEQWYAKNTTTKWAFTTYERDSESANDYAIARHFVSRVGRFASLDPLSGHTGDPQSLNRYTYVRNNPVGLVDPSGLCDVVTPDGGGEGACGGDVTGGVDIFVPDLTTHTVEGVSITVTGDFIPVEYGSFMPVEHEGPPPVSILGSLGLGSFPNLPAYNPPMPKCPITANAGNLPSASQNAIETVYNQAGVYINFVDEPAQLSITDKNCGPTCLGEDILGGPLAIVNLTAMQSFPIAGGVVTSHEWGHYLLGCTHGGFGSSDCGTRGLMSPGNPSLFDPEYGSRNSPMWQWSPNNSSFQFTRDQKAAILKKCQSMAAGK